MRTTSIRLVDRAIYIGPPGVGKTEIVLQKAKEEATKLGKTFVDLREIDEKTFEEITNNPEKYYIYYRLVAPHVYPEELSYPTKKDNHKCSFVDYIPPRMLSLMTLKDIHGVLFIDELTNVQRDDQMSMFYSIIQEKEASWTIKLSKNIKIVMASNDAEWSEIARALPKPLRNRCKIYKVTAPSIDEWREYMDKTHNNAWEKLTYAYLKAYPLDFIKPPQNDDGFTNFPTPRSWTSLAVMLHELKTQNADEEFIEETVIAHLGNEVGTRFLALLKTSINVEQALQTIRTKPEEFDTFNLNEKILVLNAFAQLKTEEITGPYQQFLKHLVHNSREFLILAFILMPKEKRIEIIRKTAQILKEAVKILAEYIA